MSENEAPQRELLADNDIEQSLLANLLLDPTLIEPVFEVINPTQFAASKHATLAQAIKLLASDDVVNAPNLAKKLKQMGKLREIGGTPYLAELMLNTVAESLEGALSWANTIRDLWQRRAILYEARFLAAKLETNSIEDPFAAVDALSKKVEVYRPSEAIELGCWAYELGDPQEEPPPQVWLLHDELTNSPAVPLGRPFLYSASGGTGKTTSLIQMGASIALGRDWLGFSVKTPGCVAICCAESDRELMRRHFWKACNALKLTEKERNEAAYLVRMYPLFGVEASIVDNHGTTPFYRQLKREFETLGEREQRKRLDELEKNRSKVEDYQALVEEIEAERLDWSAIILDPLAYFGCADTEKDNNAATAFVRAMATFCKVPGTPTVFCAHHSSKASGTNGKNDARGVTGIQDGFRGNIVLTGCQAETVRGVQLSNVKNNEAPRFADRWLVQQTAKEVGGTLRLATEAEAAMLAEAMKSKGKRRETKVKPAIVLPERPNIHTVIITKLRELGGKAQSRDWLFKRHLSGYRKAEVWSAFDLLISQNELTLDSYGSTRGRISLKAVNEQLELAKVVPSETGTTEGNEE